MAITTSLKTLRPEHPRLIALPDDISRIKTLLENDEYAQDLYQQLWKQGEALLNTPPAERILQGTNPNYRYMLWVSRTVLDRIYTLGLLYRLTNEPRWFERARTEALNAAAFTSWNPAHWLDVAEMIHALAIAYDWFYANFSAAERQTIKTSLVEKGLLEAKKGYAERAGWSRCDHNWNNVCNGGVIIGALALGDEEPELAAHLLEEAVTHLPIAMASYAPDGAWAEGPTYWGYAMRYTSAALAALNSALGTDFGLSDSPGLDQAGGFRMHSEGPTGRFFNYADCREGANFQPSLFWLAERFNIPWLAYGGQKSTPQVGPEAEVPFGAVARALLWYRGAASTQFTSPPLDVQYQAAHLAFFRSSWTDSRALYLAFKGGDNEANHSHLDLGSFVFDALGQRWISDLGGDDYHLPGYWEKRQDGRRWTYYRLATEGHNTLTINRDNQNVAAKAPLLSFVSRPERGWAVADLSAAYKRSGAKQIHRGIMLDRQQGWALVQDEINLQTPGDVIWAIHTEAEITLHESTAILTLGGETLHVQLLSPTDAQFAHEIITLNEPQKPLRINKLLLRLPQTDEVMIAVRFQPGATIAAAPSVSRLADW